MNTPVNFEIAKLLKEKGFDKSCIRFYNGKFVEYKISDNNGIDSPYINENKDVGKCLDAPTIAEVVMWLYENHKIWIYVDGDCRPHIIKDNVDLNHKGEVNRTVLLEGKTKIQYCWDSPTEAYGAAIKYVLENLIQGGNK